MLDAAANAGVSALDTAAAYGAAETVVGDWLRERPGPAPIVISKLAPLDDIDAAAIPGAIQDAVSRSRARLGIVRLDGYLVHRASDLHRPGVAEALRNLRRDGVIGAFGVSVYQPAELDAALAVDGVTLAQLPLNVFDRRFAVSGSIARAVEKGVTVFARSAFLQGVVFVEPRALPDALAGLRRPLEVLRSLAQAHDRSIAELCLQAVLGVAGVDSVVVGAARPEHLAQSVAAAANPIDAHLSSALETLAQDIDPSLIDPRKWP